jgi:glycosyltransferase involved in cell wall biosynthesis
MLIDRADILTVHSPENLAIARHLFPKKRVELVLFGINANRLVQPKRSPPHNPVRLISVGNDRHRDWHTLLRAIGRQEGLTLRIISTKINKKLVEGWNNVDLLNITDNSMLLENYDWADIAVVPLERNFHASGTTVIQEAIACGIPVICSDTGGLRAYFSDKQVKYIEPRNPESLQKAIWELATNTDLRYANACRAQARMGPDGLSSFSFARRHLELSIDLFRHKVP